MSPAKYVSSEERPVSIFLNGRLTMADGLGRKTQCLETTCQR
jgi:hypothetical protein